MKAFFTLTFATSLFYLSQGASIQDGKSVACVSDREGKALPSGKPGVWDALKQLRGGKDLTVTEMQELIINAVPGVDYPTNFIIPDKKVNCKSYNQAGFHADDSEGSLCQVFHRCDDDGNVWSFLCPNATLFNQITLVCDWFYNIDCSLSREFYDYSNSRLAKDGSPLLDDQLEIKTVEFAMGAVSHKANVAKLPPTTTKQPAFKRLARKF